jgi:hypothetical protein
LGADRHGIWRQSVYIKKPTMLAVAATVYMMKKRIIILQFDRHIHQWRACSRLRTLPKKGDSQEKQYEAEIAIVLCAPPGSALIKTECCPPFCVAAEKNPTPTRHREQGSTKGEQVGADLRATPRPSVDGT